MRLHDVNRLLLTARGDPRLRDTWSGAPLNLVLAFEHHGWHVETLSLARDGDVERVISAVPGVLRYGRQSRVFFSYLWPRYNASRDAMTRWRRQNPDVPVLHMDTMWLPYDGMGDGDYLYRDSTWRALADAFGPSPKLDARLEERHRRIYDLAGGIFVMGGWAKNELIERYGIPPSKVTVVGSGYGEISPFDGPRDYGNGNCLFVAKARFEQKGGWLLAEAFQIARKVNPRLTLTVVAPPGITIEQPGVTLLSSVSWETLQQLYCEAALFAMPALFEPWGQVYIEALVNRVPLLGLNRYGFPELSGFGEFGYTASSPDPESVAKALVVAHSDPVRLERMGALGQDHVLRKFTWDRTVEKIITKVSQCQCLSHRRTSHL